MSDQAGEPKEAKEAKEAKERIERGKIVLIDGLQGRKDLNGKKGFTLKYFEDTDRWGVRVGNESVRVRTANLTLAEPDYDDDDEDDGVMVHAKVGDQVVALDPGKLKRDFDRVVRKYGLDSDSKSGQLADFLTQQEHGKVSPEMVADKFAMDVEDAKAFLAWIQVGVQFKEQALDPNAKAMKL